MAVDHFDQLISALMRGVVKGYTVRGFCVLIFSLLSLFYSCSGEAVEEMPLYKPSLVYSALEVEILEQVNDHRASKGLNKLGILDDISHQAFLHSEHMRKNGEVCHHNFGNRFRILEEKLGAKSMGENVGYGYRTSEAFFRAWMKSQNHRKIIEGDNTHFGIAAIKTEERYYVTLIFIIK